MDLRNKSDEKDLYNKLENHNGKFLFTVIFVLIIAIGIIYAQDYYSHNEFEKQQYTEQDSQNTTNNQLPNKSPETKIDKIKNTDTDVVTININPLEDYRGNSKAKMYEIRKSYVEKSLFAHPDYNPNEEVFGQIQDGKPWWSYPAAVCSVDKNEKPISKISGLSAMSRFINNPDMLVGTYFGFYLNKYNKYKPFCESPASRTIPYELTYNPKANEFIAKYKMISYVIENKINYAYNNEDVAYPLHLVGLNAKDFGYSYIYISSLENIEMLNVTNASNKIHRFADFIHTGSSCGEAEGCNNISPRQPELEYFLTNLPAQMNIKLWKNKPISPQQTADINYKIIFERE